MTSGLRTWCEPTPSPPPSPGNTGDGNAERKKICSVLALCFCQISFFSNARPSTASPHPLHSYFHATRCSSGPLEVLTWFTLSNSPSPQKVKINKSSEAAWLWGQSNGLGDGCQQCYEVGSISVSDRDGLDPCVVQAQSPCSHWTTKSWFFYTTHKLYVWK